MAKRANKRENRKANKINSYLSAVALMLFIVSIISAVSLASSLASAAIIINEFEGNNAGSDDFEWIELYNTGGADVDLTNYYINNRTGSTLVTILGGVIPASGFFVIEEPAYLLDINELNDNLRLYNSVAALQDATGLLADGFDDSLTWARVPNGFDNGSLTNWAFQQGTKGTTNNDKDLDGYDDASAPVNGTDCNDNDALINPGITEATCNDGVDNDCDGTIDCYDSDCVALGAIGPGGRECCGVAADCSGATTACKRCNATKECNPRPVTYLCNAAYACSNSLFGDNSYGVFDFTAPRQGYCDGAGSCDYTSAAGNVCNLGLGAASEGTGLTICQNGVAACADSCADTIDNDADSCLDGVDVDCGGVETSCDGLDDNCNSVIDEGLGEDACQGTCILNGSTWLGNGGSLNCCGNDAGEASPYEISEATCNDGNDNDCDGLIDCLDSDCVGLTGPSGTECCSIDSDCSQDDCKIETCSANQCVYIDRLAGATDECGTCNACDVDGGDCVGVTADNGKDCSDDCTMCSSGTCINRLVCDNTECLLGSQQACNADGGDCVDADADSTVCTNTQASCFGGLFDASLFFEAGNKNCCGDDANEYNLYGIDGSQACCNTASECVIGGVCMNYTLTEPGAEITCDDGNDNDCDGLVDCLDSDCMGLMGPYGGLCSDANSAKIVINEVELYDFTTPIEWLELYNAEDTAVDLSGWSIIDKGNDTETIAAGILIPAKGYYIFVRPTYTTTFDNANERIILRDRSGNTADMTPTLTDEISYNDHKSWARVANGLDTDDISEVPNSEWTFQFSTRGATNDDQDLDGFLNSEFGAGDDCDDRRTIVNINKTEVAYNNLDDDCNSSTPDDDLDYDGYNQIDDCNDSDALINPAAIEADNSMDDDCDSIIDEGFVSLNIISPAEEYYSIKYVDLTIDNGGQLKKLRYSDNTGFWKTLCTNCLDYSKNVRLSEGNHILRFEGTDYEGRVYSAITEFNIDTKPPVIYSISPRNLQFSNGTFSIKYSELNLMNITLFWKNESSDFRSYTKTDCASGNRQECKFSVDISEFNGQNVMFYFNVANRIHAASSRIGYVTVDTAAPELNLIENTLSGRKLSFKLNVEEENMKSLQYMDASSRYASWRTLCSSLSLLINDGVCEKTLYLSSGNHSLSFRATDKAYNSDLEQLNLAV